MGSPEVVAEVLGRNFSKLLADEGPELLSKFREIFDRRNTPLSWLDRPPGPLEVYRGVMAFRLQRSSA